MLFITVLFPLNIILLVLYVCVCVWSRSTARTSLFIGISFSFVYCRILFFVRCVPPEIIASLIPDNFFARLRLNLQRARWFANILSRVITSNGSERRMFTLRALTSDWERFRAIYSDCFDNRLVIKTQLPARSSWQYKRITYHFEVLVAHSSPWELKCDPRNMTT